MSKFIYIITKPIEERLHVVYIDICQIYTNKKAALKAAREQSESASFFKIQSVYRVKIPKKIGNYDTYEYPEIIASYKEGKEMNLKEFE